MYKVERAGVMLMCECGYNTDVMSQIMKVRRAGYQCPKCHVHIVYVQRKN